MIVTQKWPTIALDMLWGKNSIYFIVIVYVAFYPSYYAPVKLRKPGFMNDVNSRKNVERTQLCAHNHDLYKTC